MKRKIITINRGKCNGCGLCVNACHEGALQLIDGKAALVSESYCDGLGDCLPECPMGAIHIEEREAQDYDHAAVQAHIANKTQNQGSLPCGCPSTQAKVLHHGPAETVQREAMQSELRQWPCQIKLVPARAPFLQNAKLLIAADCTAYAYPDVHRFMKNKITLIGCPKLDDEDYSRKLTEILANNEIESITVLRMEVPCCGGIVNAVKTALVNSGKMIPWNVVTIATNGEIIE